MLLNVVPVTVIVVAVGLSAARRVCASVLVVPPIPGMLTVVFDPRRTLMSAPPAGSLPAVANPYTAEARCRPREVRFMPGSVILAGARTPIGKLCGQCGSFGR